MCVFDAIAAAQQGGCFQNLGRRLQLSEDKVAVAVAAMLPALSNALDGWISKRDGMIEFLSELGQGSFAEARTNPSFFSDNRQRDRGISLLRKWRDAGGLDDAAIAARAMEAGVKPDSAAQILPWLAVLVMAAVQLKAQRPLGWIAGDMDGGKDAGNPFQYLAAHLAGTEQQSRRPAVRRMLGSLLGIDSGSRPAAGRI